MVLKSVRFASRNSRPNAVPTEISANTIGMPAATSVRNTISSTSSATAKPMNSLAPCSGGACSASPVNSVVDAGLGERRPSSRPRAPRSSRGRAGSRPRRTAPRRSRCADRSSRSRWLSSANGPLTSVADSALAALASAASMAALRSAVSSRSPSGATITTCSTAPLRASNFACEHVGGLLRVGARDRELVLERALERPERQEQDDEEEQQAAEDGSLRVRGLSARDAREQRRYGGAAASRP